MWNKYPMTREELVDKWRRNDNPRVRDAWLDRVFCGTEVLWEKGQPYRIIRQDGGRRHVPVPRWSTNRALAGRLARLARLRRPPPADEPADELCLRALVRRLEIGEGLWRELT